MCWGLKYNNGWYQLLYYLSGELSNFLAEHRKLKFEVAQVKSKLRNLRIYLSSSDAVTEK